MSTTQLAQGSPSPSQRPIYSVFFASGFGALLYQVVWQRLLALVTGSDVVSTTTVVTAFLTGLGLGSLLGARLADHLDARRAVQCFALCNLGIAAFAVFSRLLFYDLLFLRLPQLAQSRLLVFGVVFAGLLVPTLLMGLSLPLLSRAVVRRMMEASRSIGQLYAVDLLGAGTGALVSTWFLLGTLGLEGTLFLGAGLSALLGAVALFSARHLIREGPREGAAATPASASQAAGSDVALTGWCVLFFVSGFLAISLELIWLRYFGVILSASAYSFGHVLSLFLLFDAAGVLIGTRVVRRVRDLRSTFLLLQGLVVVSAVAGLLVVNHPRIASLNEWSVQDRTLWSNGLVLGLFPLVTMGPAGLLIGISFPLVQHALQTDPRFVGRRVGLAQLANILGNTTAGALTGMVLFQSLGTPGTLRLLAGLALVLVVGGWLGASQETGERLSTWEPVAVSAALLVCMVSVPPAAVFWPSAQRARPGPGHWVRVAEDRTGVSVLLESPRVTLLYSNGCEQGEIPFLRIHALLGALGPLIHPDPKRVFIVGVGSGGTAYAAGVLPGTRTVRAVEIVGSSLDLLRRYSSQPRGVVARRLFEDPRYQLRVDDARRDLALQTDRYDVIEADPIRPQSSNSGMLYSIEFFRQSMSRLTDGGLMVQWRASTLVEHTFRAVFRHGIAIGAVMVGSHRPVPFDRERIRGASKTRRSSATPRREASP